MSREPEVPKEKVPVAECRDGLARIISKELASTTHSVKSGIVLNACSTSVCRFGEKCSYVGEKPSLRS